MGYLINAWQESQKKFDMSLKAIVNIAGDESLEKPEAVAELRSFYSLIDTPTMGRLLEECYSKDKKHKFDARGFAFQDLINEMGRRLGYEVENGLYRGKKNEVGFDGLWRLDDGSCIIMESKATGDYAFTPDTVIGYRDKLVAEHKVGKKKCSILVVYGRDEKGTLRNAVKGSDEAPNIRLISANALFQLVKIVLEAKSDVPARQIVSLLRPRDYFVLDNLVELVFPETDPDIPEVEDSDDDLPAQDISDLPESPKKAHTGSGTIPALPADDLKVGKYIRTAMENLSAAGYEFDDKTMAELCGATAMHDILGMSRKLPFFKEYVEGEEKGHYIDGIMRFYVKPLTFGKHTVYLSKEFFSGDKEPFIEWYNRLS